MRKRMHPTRTIVAAAGLFGLAARPASAELYEFTLGGEIINVIGEPWAPWDEVEVGDPFSVVYIFDSEAEDQEPFPYHGVYEVIELTVEIDGVSQDAGLAVIGVRLEWPPLLSDEYRVSYYDFPVGRGGNIQLIGFDVFENDELPLNLELDGFEITKIFEFGFDLFDNGLQGSVDTFDSRVIPTPSSLLMTVTVIIGFRRRTRRSSSQSARDAERPPNAMTA
jgi:hypothetical protein